MNGTNPISPPALARVSQALVLAFALGATTVATAAPPPVRVDESWSAPGLESRKIRTVAVLPAVMPEGLSPGNPLSDSLAARLQGDGRRWMTPAMAWLGLGASEIERVALFRQVASEVRSSGRTQPRTTARVAEVLGVDALVLIRVERWERVPDATDVTNVDARAELVASDGSPLWRIAGRSRVFTRTYRPRAEPPATPKGNTLLETRVTGGGAAGPSGGSPPVSGAAGASGASGGSGGQQSPPPPPPAQKLERGSTSFEEMARARNPGQPDAGTDSFQQASGLMAAAWAAKRPAAWLNSAPAARDTTRMGSATAR